MKKRLIFNAFAVIGFAAALMFAASCSGNKKVAKKERAKYVAPETVNLDEWTYYKPVTVYYQTDNGRSWDTYKNYRVYRKQMTKGCRYVVADVNSGQVYNFSEAGNGKYKYSFNNGRESCWFNCKLDDVSRPVQTTHQ